MRFCFVFCFLLFFFLLCSLFFTAEEEETGRHQTSEFWAKLCVCIESGWRCRPAQQGPRLNTFSRSDLWVAIIIWWPQLHVDGGLRTICLLRPMCVFRCVGWF